MSITLDKARINRARITWEVTEFAENVGEAPSAVKKFVGLRKLECTVYEFIKVAQAKYPEIAGILLRNSEDEDKHLEQLEALGKHLVDCPSLDADVARFNDKFNACDDLDIVKAFALEQLVFMVVLPEFTKSTNPNVANTATWILRDEIVHVYTNRHICQQLGLVPSSLLIKACVELLMFIYSDYSVEDRNERLNRAEILLRGGFNQIASAETHVLPGSINFFEVERDNIKY